ncbi:MAG: c-type cytochrome domain-containing protein [Planctomycetaceae bacterium]
MVVALILQTAASVASELTFERDIRPILRAHCLDCHGATDMPEGGLDLRQVRRMLSGGDSGTAIVAGNADGSLLLQRVRDGEMPPGETKVTAKELETLTKWIASGAKTARPEPKTFRPDWGSLRKNASTGRFDRFTVLKCRLFATISGTACERRSIRFCCRRCRKG